MRTIKHYRRIANFDTLLGSVIGAMIKVQSYRNSDAHGIDQIVYHVNYHFVSAHVLRSALRCLDHDRGLSLLSSLEDALCPLKVVGVECRNSIMSFVCFVNHLSCRNNRHWFSPPLLC